MGLSLAHGGHLTHGMKLNFSGKLYEVAAYGVDPETMRVDMDQVREQALAEKPNVIIAGWSAYPPSLGLCRLPLHCSTSWCETVGRHGPLRRFGGSRTAPLSGTARRCGIDDRALKRLVAPVPA